MGRYISGVSGSSGSLFNMTAGENVVANNLILAAEDGTAYKANPLLSLAQLNNNTAGAVAVASKVPATPGSYYRLSPSAMRNTVAFPTGEVLYAFTGNGTTTTTNVNLSVRNITAGEVKAPVVVSTDVTCNLVGVEQLTGNLAVVWWLQASTINFAIYDKTGTLVTAETTGPVIVGTTRNTVCCRALANGDFVFFYQASGTSAKFTRYNSAGVAQGSETTVDASAAPVAVNVIALAAGGFVCHYYRGAATTGWKFARYNASGTIQGSLVTAPDSYQQGGTHANYDQTGIELATAGYIAIMRRSSAASNPWYVDIYNDSNVLQVSINVQPNGNNPDNIGSIAKCSGGFVTILSGQYCRRFAENGGQIGAEVSVTSIAAISYSNADTYSSTWIEPVASGFAVLRQADNGTIRALQFAVLDPGFTLRGSLVTIQTSGGTVVWGPCLTMLSGLALVSNGLDDTTSPVMSSFLVSRTSVFGACQASVSKGSLATVAAVGSFNLTDTYTSGGAFDVRTNTAPGNRGTVAGSSALFLGTSV